MGREYISKAEELYSVDNGCKINCMEKDGNNGQMEQNMKAHIIMVKKQAKVNSFGQMVPVIMENSLKIKWMDMVNIFKVMAKLYIIFLILVYWLI